MNQTFSDFDLIIVDDGSTDNGLEILGDFCDERLTVIKQSNSGVSVARNNGAAKARYDYLAFLDADDWWSPDFLEEMHRLINEYPQAAIYGSSYYIVKNGQNIPAKIGVDDFFVSGYIDYFKVYAKTFWVPINCSFVVVAKSVFVTENGFNSRLKFGEDFDLWVRIALNNKVAYMNNYLAYSNQDVEQSNRALQYERIWDVNEHVTFNLEYLKNEEQRIPHLKQLLDGLRVRSLMTFYIKGIHKEEVVNCLKSVNWKSQKFIHKFVYSAPLPLVKSYVFCKNIGSTLKTLILSFI